MRMAGLVLTLPQLITLAVLNRRPPPAVHGGGLASSWDFYSKAILEHLLTIGYSELKHDCQARSSGFFSPSLGETPDLVVPSGVEVLVAADSQTLGSPAKIISSSSR